MASDRLTATEVAELVERYLEAHPDASDTVDGIARWWLDRQRFDDARELVRMALEMLVDRGVVSKRTMADGVTLFRSARLNQKA